MYQSERKSRRAAHLALAVSAINLEEKSAYLPGNVIRPNAEREYGFNRSAFITFVQYPPPPQKIFP